MTDQQTDFEIEITKLNQEIIKIDDTMFIISEDKKLKQSYLEKRAYLLQQIEEIKLLNKL